MKRYCIALELIAFAIHPGDTQSTTTICLDVKSACLYLTSQRNFSFETATRQGVHDVGVIKDDDIFYSKAPEKSGFHGESRLIRFLFIREYPAIHLAKTGTFFYLLPGQKVSQKIKSNARTWFKDHIKAQPLAMGSSQGTCEGCAQCLDEFNIAHGKVGNPPKQWFDPLTMSGYQGTTPLAKGEGHHAIFVAYRSIICGHQEEEEDETGKMENT